MKINFATLLLMGLCCAACDGSSEPISTGSRIVVAYKNNSAPATICNSLAQGAQGVLSLDEDKLNTNELFCTAVFPSPTVPYAILDDKSPSRSASTIYMSLPAEGKIVILDQNLKAKVNGTVPKELTFATDPSTGAPTSFCPTRIALSPSSTWLAALDNPGDPASGCTDTTRPARVIVFSLNSEAKIAANSQGSSNPLFSSSNTEGIPDIAITETDLFIVASFASNNTVYRLTITNSNNLLSFTNKQPLTDINLNNASTLRLNFDAANQLYVSKSNVFSGAVYPIGFNATNKENMELRPALTLGANTTAASLVGPTTISRFDNSNNGLGQAAFLQPSNNRPQIKLRSGTSSATIFFAANDARFSFDKHLWAINTNANALQQYDLNDLTLPADQLLNQQFTLPFQPIALATLVEPQN